MNGKRPTEQSRTFLSAPHAVEARTTGSAKAPVLRREALVRRHFVMLDLIAF